MDPYISWTTQAIKDHTATVVKVQVVVGANGTTESAIGVGSSVRYRTDRDNQLIGTTLALGRALQTLGVKLTRRANGLVKHQDDARSQASLATLPQAQKRKAAWLAKHKTAKSRRTRGRANGQTTDSIVSIESTIPVGTVTASGASGVFARRGGEGPAKPRAGRTTRPLRGGKTGRRGA